MKRSASSHPLRSLRTVALAICVGVAPSVAFAQVSEPAKASNDEQSRELMDRGFAALKRGDVEGAHAAFAQAWSNRPHVVVGISLAEVEMRLGLFVQASEHWQYVVLNLPDSMADERETARAQLKICMDHVGAVTVQATPDHSSIVVDDKPVGESPLVGELFLEPGAHTVYATRDGRRSVGRTFRISAGGQLSFSLAVPDAVAPASSAHDLTVTSRQLTATSTVTDKRDAARFRRPIIIAGGALAVGAAALGTYFVVKRSGASDDAAAAWLEVQAKADPTVPRDSACAGSKRPDACAKLASAVDDKARFGNLAVGSFIGAGVLAAGTIVTLVLWKDDTTGEAGRSASQVTVTPLFGALTGAGISARF